MRDSLGDGVFQVKKLFINSFLMSLGIILLSVSLAYSLGIFACNAPKMLQLVGYLCWGTTFGASGWEIQTWTGKDPYAEMLSARLDKIFTITGFVTFVMSSVLD